MKPNRKMQLDGVDHINIYSNGLTELGRFLSNFACYPIVTEDGPFDSIEGYWYWLGCKDDCLRYVSGYQAKELGRELGAKDWLDSEIFRDKIRRAITIKIESHPRFLKELKNTPHPLTHYYVYGEKRIHVREAKWILEHLESFKECK